MNKVTKNLNSDSECYQILHFVQDDTAGDLISKLTEFRTDNQFLLAIAFFDATYDLCIDAEAL